MSIRWGIIGTGDVADRKGGPALYEVERSSLVGVANRTISNAEQFAKRHGDPKVFASADELVASDDIDAVYVATHPDTHRQYTELAANAGKHVLCEKPMAMSVDEAQCMIDVCKENKVALVIAFYRREFPVVRKLKELIEAGAIGRPLSMLAQTYAPFASPSAEPWRLDPAVAGGGFVMDMGSHRFDLFVHLFGAAKQVVGFTPKQTLSEVVDDAATLSMEFANGVLGTASFHWNTPIQRDCLSVVGSEGMISIEGLSNRGDLTLENGRGKQLWSLPSGTPVHLNLVERMVEHLLDGKPNPCSGEDGLATMEMIAGAYAAG